MSAFDPDTFMSSELDIANSTVSEPIPAGEYLAVVEKIDVRSVENKKGGTSVIMDLTWDLQDCQEQMAALGRDKLTVRQSVFLDMTPQGTLDMGKGKNVQLGRVRQALGQNEPGKPWRPGMLERAGPAIIKVGLRPDKNDPDMIYNEVKGCTAA